MGFSVIARGADYSYNTEYGHNVNARLGATIGVGGEIGTSQNWNTSGDYIGGASYLKGYAGFSFANVGAGYQWGSGSVGSGWYGEFWCER